MNKPNQSANMVPCDVEDRQHVTARDQQIVELRARVALLEAAVRENHEWHQQSDEYAGYAGSALEQTNIEALAQQVAQ